MYENINIPTPFAFHYETNSPSPARSSYENDTQQRQPNYPFYISLQSDSSDQDKTTSKDHRDIIPLIPPFQRNFPFSIIAILGISEFSAGLVVLVLELLTFDVALGLWCGGIYTLAGVAILILVLGTDRERHQTSIVLIFQLIALTFTIIELLSHSELYRKRCVIKSNEPTRDLSLYCQFIIVEMTAGAVVLLSTIVFSIIYFRVTIVVLKQPHGTFNMSNVINLTAC